LLQQATEHALLGGVEDGKVGHQRSRSSSSPCSIAYRTSCTRLCSCSFRSVFCTWFCTVRCDRDNRSAICLYDIPFATSRSTSVSRSVSRGVSGSSGTAGGVEERACSPRTSSSGPGG